MSFPIRISPESNVITLPDVVADLPLTTTVSSPPPPVLPESSLILSSRSSQAVAMTSSLSEISLTTLCMASVTLLVASTSVLPENVIAEPTVISVPLITSSAF